jgi:hypothetical protein
VVIRLDLEICKIGKGGIKRGAGKRLGGERVIGVARFCSPCVCLGIILM